MSVSRADHVSSQNFDVCVVGAGPVGLSVAIECTKRGLSVLLVEAGTARPSRAAEPSDATIIDLSKHGSVADVMRQALGGTSWVWGGRCVAFDDIDFEQRGHVPHSGWPIGHAEVKRWYALAAYYLDCGAPLFHLPAKGWENLDGVSFDTLERLSRQAKIANTLDRSLKRASHLSLSLGERVLAVDLDASGEQVAGLTTLDKAGKRITRQARSYVLACGGLETTRLLLELQQSWPTHFGGEGGPLGRYYMGHLSGTIADITLTDPSDFKILDYARDASGAYVRRRMRIDDDVQREQSLLNTAFWADSPRFSDPAHRNGALSALYLGLRSPVGRYLLSQSAHQANIGLSPWHYRQHVANILLAPFRTLKDLAGIAAQRWLMRSMKKTVLPSRSGRYVLRYHAEQLPSPASRVYLSKPGQEGTRTHLVVDLQFTEEDAVSIVKAHNVLDRAFRKSGKARLEFHHPAEERVTRVLEQASDGYHQIGTARMSTSPRDGVVREDCSVHGLSNLFLAGSCVFPTSGQANPTFLAVALGTRLAARLAEISAIVSAAV